MNFLPWRRQRAPEALPVQERPVSPLAKRLQELLADPGEWAAEMIGLKHSSGLELSVYVDAFSVSAVALLDGESVSLSGDDWVAVRQAYYDCRAAIRRTTEERMLEKLDATKAA